MSSDLRLDPGSSGTPPALKSAAPLEPGPRAAPETAQAAAPVAAAATASPATEAPAALQAAAPGTTADLPNPRLHADLALNRLVLEFFNAQGTLTNSIPSQKQLEAYRLAAFAGSGQTTKPQG